jgi:hypothetical protein
MTTSSYLISICTIPKVLDVNSSLPAVHLDRIDTGSEGFSAIAESLNAYLSLTSLDLS